MKKSTVVEISEIFNHIFSNMFFFDDADKELYDACIGDVFSEGVCTSYMSATFFAQFTSEILIGMLSSFELRKYLLDELDDEKCQTKDRSYWDASMEVKRFGRQGVDYSRDKMDLMDMINDSYAKIYALNDWYGAPEGKKEFVGLHLDAKDICDIKRIICEYAYFIRRYDFNEVFANSIMKYAGIVANQIRKASPRD